MYQRKNVKTQKRTNVQTYQRKNATSMNRLFTIALLFLLHSSLFISRSAAQTDCKLTHKVAKKETIYGISHQYGLTQEELLAANPQLGEKGPKKGTLLCIPYSNAERDSLNRVAAEQAEAERRAQMHQPNSIRLAIILPFALNAPRQSDEAQKMIDFYKGVLLVVDSLKKVGLNLNVLVLDEGTAEASNIKTALVHSELPDVDLIIGPGRSANVDAVAAYAQQHQIPLVLPFANTDGIVGGRPYVFQCNASKHNHYQKVANRIVKSHASDNIVFIDREETINGDSYVAELIQRLTSRGIPFNRVHISDLDKKLPPLLDYSKKNVLISTSASTGSFDWICQTLNDLDVASTYSVQLIGSPEWQTLSGKSQNNMYKYNATYFATFYTNTFSTRTMQFCQLFYQNFGHQQFACFPRYGEMGHDIAAFFLTALQRYGDKFFDNIQRHDFNSLQLPLHFTRKDDQSGYINTATYIINYKADGGVFLNTF